MLYRFYQWLLSLLPACMLEPADTTTAGAGAGYTPPRPHTPHTTGATPGGSTTTGAGDTTTSRVHSAGGAGTTGRKDAPPDSMGTDRGTAANDYNGSGRGTPEPVKGCHEGSQATQQEQNRQKPHFTMKDTQPPEIVYDWKKKGREDNGKKDNGRGGR